MEPKRRGRPPKNKPKTLIVPEKIAHQARHLLRSIQNPVTVKRDTFSETIAKMVEADNKVNWEKLARKQETELKIVRQENDDLAKICVERWNEIEYLNKLVKYLEGRYENLAIRSR